MPLPWRTARTIRPITPASSWPPRRPNPPWQRQMAASNSASNSRSRTSSSSKVAGRRSAAAASRASATKSGERSTPTTWIPRRASASEWRPGPQPTSSTRWPGSSASASIRNPTSCSVPFVNALRRYAGPRNRAIGRNQSRFGVTSPCVGRKSDAKTGWSFRRGPVGAEAEVDLEGDGDLAHRLHHLAHERLDALALVEGHLEHELVVDRQDHPRPQVLALERGVELDHRQLEDV